MQDDGDRPAHDRMEAEVEPAMANDSCQAANIRPAHYFSGSSNAGLTGDIAIISAVPPGRHSAGRPKARTSAERPPGAAMAAKGKAAILGISVMQSRSPLGAALTGFYAATLRMSGPQFAAAMAALPVLLSAAFAGLYFLDPTPPGGVAAGLGGGAAAFGAVFMYSLSLCTSLQTDVTPQSEYALVVANANALMGQLIFVFLSGAVFARLSQPAHPILASRRACIGPSTILDEDGAAVPYKEWSARIVLTGLEPIELVDAKVDLTYMCVMRTRYGGSFRAIQNLKLLRWIAPWLAAAAASKRLPPPACCLSHAQQSQWKVRSDAFVMRYSMLVRHVLDETSFLYGRSMDDMDVEDGIFCLSMMALDRSSMQPVFHSCMYAVADDEVVKDARFEDMVTLNADGKRTIDHRKLHCIRALDGSPLPD
eukprot:SM000215S06718  [mRNA]  locus=s215:4942:7967:- [translate_table: standard]